MSGGDDDNRKRNGNGNKGSERNKGNRRKTHRDDDDEYDDEKKNGSRKRDGKHNNGKPRIEGDKERKRGRADNKWSSSTFSGQSDTSGTAPSMPTECACVETSGREGVCYDITDYETMACKARSCEDKYECVISEAARQVIKAELEDNGNHLQLPSGSRQEAGTSLCRLKKVSKRIIRNTMKPGYCNQEATESWAYFWYTNVV